MRVGAVGSAVLAALAAAAFAWGGDGFCLDDAWIHLAYAKSLRLGDGLSYNPGDWETGASSPLWVLLLAAFPIDRAPVAIAKGLGIGLQALSAALAAFLAGGIARAQAEGDAGAADAARAAWVAGILVALQPTLLLSAGSGMEVCLAGAAILGALAAVCAERTRLLLAFALGFCAVLARPEALFALAGAALVLARGARRRAAAAALFGGAAALGLWVLYCLVLTGYPWPNTRYTKAVGGGLEGLVYVAVRVLPTQPWLVGLGGAVLVWIGVQRGRRAGALAPLALFVAWLASVAAIAASRPLPPAVLFYASRYFEIVTALPLVLVGVGFASLRARRPRLALAALAPVAAVLAFELPSTHAIARAQEQDVRAIHVEPAQVVAQTLPPESVVIVEGAGAARFFAPRSMTIVDMLGLNDRVLAHARDDIERVCALVRRAPTHVLVPGHLMRGIVPAFELAPLRAFRDDSYVQTVFAIEHAVLLARITGVRAEWSTRCRPPPR